MAQVLVAHSDYSVRAMMALALGEEGMHDVICTPDAELAIAALWTAPSPVTVLIDERLQSGTCWGILAAAANDGIAGLLSRHRYILLSTSPDIIFPEKRSVMSKLGVVTLTLPFELETLLRTVEESASHLITEPALPRAETVHDVFRLPSRHSA